MALSKKGTEQVSEMLQKLAGSGRLDEANALYSRYAVGTGAAADPRLTVCYADILCEAGYPQEAEKLLVAELQKEPEHFSLLIKLGNLDEKHGDNLNAFDLYQRAEFAATDKREKHLAARELQRVKEKIYSTTNIQTDAYTVNIKGNKRPLELQYDLKQLSGRKKLLDAVIENIDPRAKTVLEVESDAGVIAKNLTDHGFKVEAMAENMDDIVLAMGFEYTEMLRKAGVPSPAYYHLKLDQNGARRLDKKDVIMVLPPRAEFYAEKGAAGTAALLGALFERTKRQLFFLIPPAREDSAAGPDAEAVLQALKERESFEQEPVLCHRCSYNGLLYRVDRRQASPGNPRKVLPRGLEVAGSRSHIFEVEVKKCRSLNGFGYTEKGWDHFVALLKQVQENPKLAYEESIVMEFFKRYQPQNRQEHLFGKVEEAVPPLDQGWTILPWTETRDRIPNPVKSPSARGGNHHYGPNSEQFVVEECKRVLTTYRVIRDYGYLPEIFPDGYILGYFLKDGDDYRFCVKEGQHRAAAVGFLGYEIIKCKFAPNFLPVIDIKKSKSWPQVKSGLYSKELAEKVFYYYFEEDGQRKAKELGLL